MSICVVSDFLPGLHTTWGGAEIACARILRLLRSRGMHPLILTTEPTETHAARPPDLHVLPTYRR